MPAYTLADIRGMVQSRLENNTLLYQNSYVDQDVNEAIGVIQLRYGPVSATVTVPGGTVANQHLYAVPAGVIYPTAVRVNGVAMGKTSFREIGLKRPNWLSESDDSGVQVQSWVPIDLKTFGLWTAPTTGSLPILVTGPADLSALSGSATLNIDDKYLEMIVDLAAHTLAFVEGGQIFQQASVLYQKFIGRGKADERWQRMKWPRYFAQLKQAETKEDLGGERQ